MRTLHRSVLALLVLTGCEAVFPLDAPVDAPTVALLFPGKYEGTTTNGADGCKFLGWTIGTQVVTLGVQQELANVDLSFTGAAGRRVFALYNTAQLGGTATDTTLAVEVVGDRTFSSSGCDYTFNGQLDATLAGDVLSGKLVHRAITDASAACDGFTNCENVSELQVTRIP